MSLAYLADFYGHTLTKEDVIAELLDGLQEVDLFNAHEMKGTNPARTLVALFTEEIKHLRERDDEGQKCDDENEATIRRQEERITELEEELEDLKEDPRLVELDLKLRATEERLAASEQLIPDYSDMLALARRFVSTAERLALPTKHARPTGRKRSK